MSSISNSNLALNDTILPQLTNKISNVKSNMSVFDSFFAKHIYIIVPLTNLLFQYPNYFLSKFDLSYCWMKLAISLT
jgi:hypothetical protein